MRDGLRAASHHPPRHTRRAAFGAKRALTSSLVDATIEKMGVAYPNLVKERDLIVEVLEREETGFARTLKTGLSLLEEAQRDVVSSGATVFPATCLQAPRHARFPIELTDEIVSESGLSVDRGAFDAAMTEQRERPAPRPRR